MAIESSTTTTVTRASRAASVGLLVARIPLGVYFIMAAAPKLSMGVSTWVEQTLPVAPKWLPTDVLKYFLGALPWVELVVGVLLIIGLLTRVAAGTAALLLISFTIGYTGVSGRLAENVNLPFHPNLVYLGTALAIMLCGPGWMSLDGLIFRPRRRVVVAEDTGPNVVP
jgi:uncharacterized membrane protein YphA (DoxX/SURF4 family)